MQMRTGSAAAEPLVSRLYSKAGSALVEGVFEGLSRAGRLHPDSRLERHGVECLPDVAYQNTGLEAHRLDVYRPANRQGPLPVCFYVHGGGFRILSKETHWLMGLIFARRGYAVFNINYRLAPAHPFPAAVQDTCQAFSWVVRNAEAHGGDPARLVLAGESAGANLITSLTLALCYPRREPYARTVWDLGSVPRAVVPACGIYQVSGVERFRRKTGVSRFVWDRIREVSRSYLPDREPPCGEELELADPLTFLENGEPPHRPLPPFFLPVGTRDPLLDDTRRLDDALRRLGASSEARYYAGEAHAFHALVWRRNARRCWKDTFDFLRDRIEGP